MNKDQLTLRQMITGITNRVIWNALTQAGERYGDKESEELVGGILSLFRITVEEIIGEDEVIDPSTYSLVYEDYEQRALDQNELREEQRQRMEKILKNE